MANNPTSDIYSALLPQMREGEQAATTLRRIIAERDMFAAAAGELRMDLDEMRDAADIILADDVALVHREAEARMTIAGLRAELALSSLQVAALRIELERLREQRAVSHTQ